MADETDQLSEAIRESAADKRALLNGARGTGAGKVTFVTLRVGLEDHRFQIDYNGFCELAGDVNGIGPMELYQRIVTGKALASEVHAVIRAGLKGGGAAKAGPIVDRIMQDRPLGEAIAIAETVLAAALVGVDPAETEET